MKAQEKHMGQRDWEMAARKHAKSASCPCIWGSDPVRGGPGGGC